MPILQSSYLTSNVDDLVLHIDWFIVQFTSDLVETFHSIFSGTISLGKTMW